MILAGSPARGQSGNKVTAPQPAPRSAALAVANEAAGRTSVMLPLGHSTRVSEAIHPPSSSGPA